MSTYTQGVCEDGAAILKDGQMMTIEEILVELRANPWIEITEDNLPDQIGHYLAKEGSTVYFAFYNSDGKWCWENSFIEPTKYMPIPGDNQC